MSPAESFVPCFAVHVASAFTSSDVSDLRVAFNLPPNIEYSFLNLSFETIASMNAALSEGVMTTSLFFTSSPGMSPICTVLSSDIFPSEKIPPSFWALSFFTSSGVPSDSWTVTSSAASFFMISI